MKIDAHQHFWNYNPEEYEWIDDTMAALQSDFLPEHLQPELERVGLEGTIGVQARQKIEETSWLLELAQEHDFLQGVVGWVPLASLQCQKYLDLYSLNPSFRGVRHVIQDEPDDYYILRKDFNQGVGLLEEYDLIYEILIREKHIPQTIRFVDDHPHQLFVLDHIGKPMIREGLHTPWRENITTLAERENVFCKFSGLVTEADYFDWSERQLKPYFEIVLDAFWPARLMFGSDWPVCTLACEYTDWHAMVEEWTSALSGDEYRQFWGGTAQEVYNLQENDD